MDDLPSYANAAQWLRPAIRESIEATMPCTSGRPHEWDARRIDIQRMESAFTVTVEHWGCRNCGTMLSNDPASYEPSVTIQQRWELA